MRRILPLAVAIGLIPAPAHAVINGGPADQSETGWFASYTVEGGRCGGTIIDSRWILTAAHCAESVATFGTATVRVNPKRFGKGTPVYTVDRVLIHPSFRPKADLPNDIALLHVTKNLPKARVVLNTNPSTPIAGQRLLAYGFGMTGPKDLGSSRLMVAPMFDQAGPDGRCGTWRRSRFHSAEQICANDPVERIDTCGGDSGGPLVQGSALQVGIVSFGVGICNGNPKKPGIYTRVSAYADWIEQAKTAPQILVGSAACPLPDRMCQVTGGKSLRLRVRNAGQGVGTWQVDSVPAKIRVSTTGGTLTAGRATQLTVKAKPSAKGCTALTVSGTNLRPTTFRLYINGGTKGC